MVSWPAPILSIINIIYFTMHAPNTISDVHIESNATQLAVNDTLMLKCTIMNSNSNHELNRYVTK